MMLFYDYVLVGFISFVSGVLFEYHPIIALAGTLWSIILKLIIDISKLDFSDEPDA